MIRVGFIMPAVRDGWLGGVSYYRNLLRALVEWGEDLEPVIFTSVSGLSRLREEFPDIEAVATSLADSPPAMRRIRRAVQFLFGRDPFLENVLVRGRIDVLSHSGWLGRRSCVPSMAWIPDFQEHAFPSFFSARERASRARNMRNTCQHATTVILSSNAAERDLESMASEGDALHEVLPFVADVPPPEALPKRGALAQRYGLPERYFHLPNQFWVHKNHAVVLQALALLRKEGYMVSVVATGHNSDHRHPDHFRALMEIAQNFELLEAFRPLGVVPVEDVMGLMRDAVAVVNPSKFEGWSTSVEEAKSLGKTVILSDIPVHREQSPERGVYFAPDDPAELARALRNADSNWTDAGDRQHMEKAARELPQRRQAFARCYREIVERTLQHHARRKTAHSTASRRVSGA